MLFYGQNDFVSLFYKKIKIKRSKNNKNIKIREDDCGDWYKKT